MKSAIAAELLRQSNRRPNLILEKIDHTVLDRATNRKNTTVLRMMRRHPVPADESLEYRPQECFRVHSRYTDLNYLELEDHYHTFALMEEGISGGGSSSGSSKQLKAKPWVVPEIGELDVVVTFTPNLPNDLELTNATGMAAIYWVMNEFRDDAMDLLQLFCMDYYFLCSQVKCRRGGLA